MSYLFDRQPGQPTTKVWVGDAIFGAETPVIIAGPCSVESEEQIVATAMAVKKAGAQMLRGGVEKPRTNPYSFQGLGEKGLQMLRQAGEVADLPIIAEVMSEESVDFIASAVDMLQIGARNMQNYSLLKKVAATGKPVLLKRHPSATVDEWLNASEYILAGGNPDVVLCERGMYTRETEAYRSSLDISAIIGMRELTHLPIIADPSHSAGKRRNVPRTAYAALAAGADGLIVEVHPDPDKALSDAKQQLNFQEFGLLMQGLEKYAGHPAGVGT